MTYSEVAKVKGQCTYLYRAVDKKGDTIDFYLSSTRNKKAAEKFFGKALRGLKEWEKSQTINTDKAPTYGPAISELKEEGLCPEDLSHRQLNYLNNIVEADHGKVKRLINPVHGFKSMKTAYATIKGFELMRMFSLGQMNVWLYGQGLRGEIRLMKGSLVFTLPNQKNFKAIINNKIRSFRPELHDIVFEEIVGI